MATNQEVGVRLSYRVPMEKYKRGFTNSDGHYVQIVVSEDWINIAKVVSYHAAVGITFSIEDIEFIYTALDNVMEHVDGEYRFVHPDVPDL